jgi:hypothetical protein
MSGIPHRNHSCVAVPLFIVGRTIATPIQGKDVSVSFAKLLASCSSVASSSVGYGA